MESKKIQSMIDACTACAEACDHCATENKGKDGMEHSTKLCITCAETSRAVIAGIKANASMHELYEKCEEACNACADECEKHSDMHHCKKCAYACRKCATECKAMLEVASK